MRLEKILYLLQDKFFDIISKKTGEVLCEDIDVNTLPWIISRFIVVDIIVTQCEILHIYVEEPENRNEIFMEVR